MSSLDDTFDRMQAFSRALARFQESLQASLRDLDRHHAAVDPLWRDERRRAYDAEFSPLHEILLRYAREQGPAFLQFLDEKIRALDLYLHG